MEEEETSLDDEEPEEDFESRKGGGVDSPRLPRLGVGECCEEVAKVDDDF